jgi:tetratricopeptide (TPR) repeat protein
MAPDFPMAHYWLAHYLVEKGSLEDVVSEMRRAVELTHGATFARAGLAYALAKAGQKDEAIRIVGELTKGEEYTDAADIAMVFAGLRQRENALDWLEKAYEMRSSGVTNIGWVGWYREFHSDERFLRLVDRMRIRIPAGL